MKVQTCLALIAAAFIPAIAHTSAVGQQYRVASAQSRAPAGYAQQAIPAPVPAPQHSYAPAAAAAAPMAYPAAPNQMAYPAAPNSGVSHSLGDQSMSMPQSMPMNYGGGGGCDSGGCSDYGMNGGAMMGGGYDADYGGGGFIDGGFAGGGCPDGSCSSGGIGGLGGLGGLGGQGCCGGGTYFTVIGGGVELDDQRSTAPGRDLLVDFNQGYAIGGAIGRRVGRNFRSELEYVFRSQTPEVAAFNSIPGAVDGDFNSHAVMMNFTYDLVLGQGRIVPYLGVGAGVGSIDSRVDIDNAVGPSSFLDGDDSSVAYQWMAGITFRARPNMEMFVEYRFFEIDDPKLNLFSPPSIGGQFSPNVLTNSEYISNDIMAGIRFSF